MSNYMSLDEIRIDGGTQMREQINEKVVADYAEVLRESISKFPPIILFYDGVNYWLADGFHRYFAHQAANIKEINCTINNGTKRDAIFFALNANANHGLRRTNADKHKSVIFMLNDDEWRLLSDRLIADACGVSHPYVAKIRRSVVTVTTMLQDIEEKVEKEIKEKSVEEPKLKEVKHDESDFAPDASEIEANMLREQADRELIQKMLDSDDAMAELHAEVKRLTHLNANFQTRINVLMREKNEAIKMVTTLQKQLDKVTK